MGLAGGVGQLKKKKVCINFRKITAQVLGVQNKKSTTEIRKQDHCWAYPVAYTPAS